MNGKAIIYLMTSNTMILSLQFNGRFIPNFKRTDEFQSSRKSLLPNSENYEHLKIFRNVDYVLANHNKVQDIYKQTSN